MVCEVLVVIFFFKQRTGYEMRISDWSSDVCSSDLKYMKRWGTLALIVVVLVVVVGGIKAWSIHSMIEGFKAQGIQKEAVSTYKVSYQQWRPTVNVIGSLRAVKEIGRAHV